MSGAHPGAVPFDRAVEIYEEARPEYPPEAVARIVERLGLRPGRAVLDLGAGTGKLTRQLVGTGARIVAVEPLPAMRARLEELVPEAEALAGSAEAIPLPDGSIDAVTVGQAFHWFRVDEALPELHRVLRSGGGIALVWNVRDPADPVNAAVDEILRPYRTEAGAERRESWRALEQSPLFGPVERQDFRFDRELDAELLVRLHLSVSFVAALDDEEQQAVAERIRAVAPSGRFALPYVTEVFVCYRT